MIFQQFHQLRVFIVLILNISIFQTYYFNYFIGSTNFDLNNELGLTGRYTKKTVNICNPTAEVNIFINFIIATRNIY
jgi:hypothetical protein